ncbi:hypothetical protein ACGFX8_01710 [Streptomyces sp. NPDC048362]|uniref:hypothetical protein n=1 Tax=Streptomyces sp. NPDC048362 TaxID=3365539 RepID=UPI003719541C
MSVRPCPTRGVPSYRGGAAAEADRFAVARGIDVPGEDQDEHGVGRASGEDRLTGVWPGADERPEIVHTVRDRAAGLRLVRSRPRGGGPRNSGACRLLGRPSR